MVNDLAPLVNSERFQSVFDKLVLSEILEDSEKSYILSCAIIFLSEYVNDKRKKRLFDAGYYIVLKYSVEYEDFDPLYDVSVNFGFFPISSYINREGMIDGIDQVYISYKSESYFREGIYETLEQKESRGSLLSSNQLDRVFVAPTSYGKSSFVSDVIKGAPRQKIAVVVPTKSLLAQTYKLVLSAVEDRKVIFHDEMYNGEDDFVGVLTQERALRLMGDFDISFDAIVVDEAHNLFGGDFRSILLTRLLRKNRKRNPISKIYYLSPLISDPNNVRFSEVQNIDSYVISRNMKEAEIFEFRKDGYNYRYDKFCNKFHRLRGYSNYFDHIFSSQGDKNFFYLRRPVKIQEFSEELYNSLPDGGCNSELLEMSETISRNVHSDFYCVDFVKKGVVYLHGQLPDILKEYMEHKFKVTDSLRYIVANSVVLEGVNFPVDKLFILNTRSLTDKGIVNLIGRVNRLNMVFNESGHSLTKLLPKIYFINSDAYSGKDKMENKIVKLRAPIFKDEIKNPTLLAYSDGFSDGASESSDGELAESKDVRVKAVEDFLIENDGDDSHSLKVAFIESGLQSLYYDPEKAFSIIAGRIDSIGDLSFKESGELIDLIFEILIRGNESNISDTTFLRLRKERARAFYKMFLSKIHRYNLNQLIDDFVDYFNKIRKKESEKIFYIGTAFGEISKEWGDGQQGKAVYIDLSKKTQKVLSNLALVKIKMESDFLSYKLNEYVKFLYRAGVVEKGIYEKFVYGSANRIGSKLAQLGISGSSINKIDSDGMLSEVRLNDIGRVEASSKFMTYLEQQDDLFQFEIQKYLVEA